MKVNIVGEKLTLTQYRLIEQSINNTFSKYQLDNTQDWQINVALVDEDKSKELNKKYASNNYATDVLSFNYQEDSPEPRRAKNFGDIAICIPIAKSNAEQNMLSLDSELARLSAHASLHLLGFDHQGSIQQTRFSIMQDDIISSLKV